jgi:LPS-assembly protein
MGILCGSPVEAAQEREWKNVYRDYSEEGVIATQKNITATTIPISNDIAKQADALSSIPSANTQASSGNEPPVDLIADKLEHDEAMQTVTATGNVELVQAGKILTADKVSYHLATDTVRATGNVVLKDTDGTVYRGDDVELTQDMKDGFVTGMQILLADGSRFGAEQGKRTGGTTIDLKQASYTPCEPCKEDPSRPPVWQLRAAEIHHNDETKMISYRDAWFEMAGVPLAYVPYFAHPDGTEKQKSGLLAPFAGYDSNLGVSYGQEYYWAIAPDKDVTLGAQVFSNVAPVALAEYRQRFDNAEVQMEGSVTYSSRQDRSLGVTQETNKDLRGHLKGTGLWNMSDTWRSGYEVDVSSDDQYRRQYDIDSEDILENELYAERLSGRNYAVGRVMAFQDLRVSDRRVDQPSVLPEAYASFYGAPNDTLGGRWNAEISASGLYREGSGQDVARGSMELGWQRRYVTGFGLVNTWDALLRGDIYNVQDRNVSLSGEDATQTRGFAQGNWNVSYPFVNSFDNGTQWILEPIASLTVGTNVDYDKGVPNEDSRDFTLDPTNLFEPNRSPGYDIIEDRAHVTYGLRSGLHLNNGYRGEVFFGQSRRIQDDDNPFAVGSGLSDQNSDYVGQVTAHLGQYADVDYRFQLENDNWSSQRHELDASFNFDPISLNTRYFYANALSGSDLDESREQIRQSARLRLNENWYLGTAIWYDFGKDEGLRQLSYGIDYIGQCLTFSATAGRTFTRDSTGDSGTQIMFRMGLKNLGEFQTSGIDLGDGSDEEDDDEEKRKSFSK